MLCLGTKGGVGTAHTVPYTHCIPVRRSKNPVALQTKLAGGFTRVKGGFGERIAVHHLGLSSLSWRGMAGPNAKSNRKTSPGMFSRLHLTVECPTEFGQTVHVSGSSFLAGLRYPSLVRFVFSLLGVSRFVCMGGVRVFFMVS